MVCRAGRGAHGHAPVRSPVHAIPAAPGAARRTDLRARRPSGTGARRSAPRSGHGPGGTLAHPRRGDAGDLAPEPAPALGLGGRAGDDPRGVVAHPRSVDVQRGRDVSLRGGGRCGGVGMGRGSSPRRRGGGRARPSCPRCARALRRGARVELPTPLRRDPDLDHSRRCARLPRPTASPPGVAARALGIRSVQGSVRCGPEPGNPRWLLRGG